LEAEEPMAQIPSEVADEGSPTMAISQDIDDGATETSRENNSKQWSTPHPHLPSSDEERCRKPTKGSEPFEKWERDEMENLLHKLNGHLGIIFTTSISHAN